MRRQPTLQTQNQNRLALDEIERLKADIRRFSDGSGLVITTPTTGSGPTDGPPTTPGAGVEPLPHVLYGSKHTRSLRVTAATGLDIDFEQGQEWVAGVFYSISAGSLTMADDDTNYVFVNTSGAVAVNTTGFPSNSTPLAEVVTVAGAITSVADRRSYLAGGVHGGGILLGNPLEVGTDDADQGTLILYGDGAGSAEGGEIRLHMAADYDATIENWRIEAYEDDVRFVGGTEKARFTYGGQLQLPTSGSGAGILIGGDCLWYRTSASVWRTPDFVVMDSGLIVGAALTVQGATGLSVGANDTTRGIARLFGSAGGSALGGVFQVYLAADHDGAFELWAIDALEDDLRFSTSDGVVSNRMTAEGQLQMPIVGIGGGILVGGDVLLYRSVADTWRTPDSMIIDGTLAVGTVQAYTESNVIPDRSYDADATTLDEIADVLGTLIVDLRAIGLIS